jgi:hypothetical protein
MPNDEEKERALKYLEQQGSRCGLYRGRAVENGGPNLVDALHEVIQQTWTSEILPRSWTEGKLCPVSKKGDKLDCKNYRGICLF